MFESRVIANAIINYCNERDLVITNLKLQALMFIAQVYFATCYASRLIIQDFFTTALCPWEKLTHAEFSVYASSQLPMQEAVYIPPPLGRYLEELLDVYAELDVWELVSIAANFDSAKYTLRVFGPNTPVSMDNIVKDTF